MWNQWKSGRRRSGWTRSKGEDKGIRRKEGCGWICGRGNEANEKEKENKGKWRSFLQGLSRGASKWSWKLSMWVWQLWSGFVQAELRWCHESVVSQWSFCRSSMRALCCWREEFSQKLITSSDSSLLRSKRKLLHRSSVINFFWPGENGCLASVSSSAFVSRFYPATVTWGLWSWNFLSQRSSCGHPTSLGFNPVEARLVRIRSSWNCVN